MGAPRAARFPRRCRGRRASASRRWRGRSRSRGSGKGTRRAPRRQQPRGRAPVAEARGRGVGRDCRPPRTASRSDSQRRRSHAGGRGAGPATRRLPRGSRRLQPELAVPQPPPPGRRRFPDGAPGGSRALLGRTRGRPLTSLRPPTLQRPAAGGVSRVREEEGGLVSGRRWESAARSSSRSSRRRSPEFSESDETNEQD